MRSSKLFFRTLKEAPADSEIASHQLLERGGYLQKIGKGLYIYTPLLWRVMQKITDIIRKELDKAGCQELLIPYLQPKKFWEQSGRWDDFNAENLLYTTEDREGHELCLAPTHEEIVTYLVSQWVTSHKKLPINLYQIATKFRDEIRPRFGLMRGKEFMMKDGYAFTASEEQMEQQYKLMRKTYSAIFTELELDFGIIEAHGGKIGSGKSEEFQARAEIGEDQILTAGNYTCNVEVAVATPPAFTYDRELKNKEVVQTPNTKTIEELARFLKCEKAHILKVVVCKLIKSEGEQFVALGIRGDREINVTKVTTHFGATEIEFATEEEILKKVNSYVGFVGPEGLSIPFYLDHTTAPMKNFVVAFNQKDQHYINCNFGRDLEKGESFDFLLAEEGDGCPHQEGATYHMQRGIEVGHIFNINTRYSEKLGATFQDEQEKMRPFWMGTYGIGVGRTLAAIVEQKHDERGIIWPQKIAPFQIVITAVSTKNEEQVVGAEKIYKEFCDAGFEPLLDDRAERLGFKLKDSDLIGIPYKLIVGRGFLENGQVEIEPRVGEKQMVASEQLVSWAKEHLNK